ncbi:hypothetical protein [Nocardia wallacei]|uniref:hypothetical protein n=1 Tax=Nocardia wallacei TaxID=480035 RepID=UPI002454E34D|nr:hypothetical protein [Nocardia wallacei]
MSITFFVADHIADPRVEDLELNVCNGNAVDLLAVLGYISIGGAEDVEPADDSHGVDHMGELAGEADAEDFLGRVLIAQALSPGDPGRPARPINDRFVVCARREGHLDEKLLHLERLARYCLDIDAAIAWS